MPNSELFTTTFFTYFLRFLASKYALRITIAKLCTERKPDFLSIFIHFGSFQDVFSLLKGQAAVGPTVQSGRWQAPRINGFLNFSQVMSRSVTDCKHAGCWNQLIYWNVFTFVVEDDWCKILKICTL